VSTPNVAVTSTKVTFNDAYAAFQPGLTRERNPEALVYSLTVLADELYSNVGFIVG